MRAGHNRGMWRPRSRKSRSKRRVFLYALLDEPGHLVKVITRFVKKRALKVRKYLFDFLYQFDSWSGKGWTAGASTVGGIVGGGEPKGEGETVSQVEGRSQGPSVAGLERMAMALGMDSGSEKRNRTISLATRNPAAKPTPAPMRVFRSLDENGAIRLAPRAPPSRPINGTPKSTAGAARDAFRDLLMRTRWPLWASTALTTVRYRARVGPELEREELQVHVAHCRGA